MAMSTGWTAAEGLSKMWTSFCIFNVLYCIANAETYNTYYGTPADSKEVAKFQAKNISHICISNFKPCDENEWSRVDGSCNNLENPTHGMYHTPMWRMLPAYYSADYEPRKTKSGKDFPLARYLRLMLMKVGDSISEVFATSLSYFAEFAFGDVGSVHDIRLYLRTITHCCKPEGLTDKRCTPNFIPENDNVHRFSGIKCHNLTRPLSFQSTGCAPTNTVPERINFVTTFFDISNVYYHAAGSIEQNRAYEGGRLKVEVVNGGSFPSDANETTTCFLKDAVATDCARNVPNGLLGTNLFSTYFWRLHNYIADALVLLNPCWDDETVFNNAKDINIAWYKQVLMYEFYPLMLGRENMINNNIIGCDGDFRDPYDKNVDSNLAMEFAYALRWFHSTQDARQEMYDKNDKFINTQAVVNYSLRVQDLAFHDTLLQMTHGIYMQPAGGFDDTVHPDIADSGLGRLAKAFDILTADLARGRYFGLAPYMKYRDYCSDYTISHEKFEDLSYIMKPNVRSKIVKFPSVRSIIHKMMY
ncbi:hypothetical protein O3G_MSEX010547 [Manduca sexta]|uniref:Peroxidase n=1 Tax=Manduca sexta TaxID=7130 RepID=A0A921ZJN2_MANSE|nr:hypothetical protein O3G_MSEX010547 [Manduca sexta]